LSNRNSTWRPPNPLLRQATQVFLRRRVAARLAPLRRLNLISENEIFILTLRLVDRVSRGDGPTAWERALDAVDACVIIIRGTGHEVGR
jgi:hypothetical protein